MPEYSFDSLTQGNFVCAVMYATVNRKRAQSFPLRLKPPTERVLSLDCWSRCRRSLGMQQQNHFNFSSAERLSDERRACCLHFVRSTTKQLSVPVHCNCWIYGKWLKEKINPRQIVQIDLIKRRKFSRDCQSRYWKSERIESVYPIDEWWLPYGEWLIVVWLIVLMRNIPPEKTVILRL